MNPYQLFVKSIEFANEQFEDFKVTKDLSQSFLEVMGSLYRKIIELSEGVRVCAENKLKGPAELNSRGLIEVYLAFKYIMQDSNLASKRAIAYKIGYHKQQLESARTPLDTYLESDELEEFNKRLVYHENELQRKEFQKVLKEHDRLQYNNPKNKRKFIPKWHSLYDGPESINKLAETVARDEEDKMLVSMLYSMLSKSAHNYLALRDVYKTSTNTISIGPIHGTFSPMEDNYNLVLARSLLTSIIRDFTIHVYPESKDNFVRFRQELIPFLTY